MLKIIVAPDSFKGSLTAIQAAEAMKSGIHLYDSTITTKLLPAADGGEGTIRSLVEATSGKIYSVDVHNPIGQLIKASYGVLGDKETCVIEIAAASGLMTLNENEQNPLIASTFGTGELILHALNEGYRKFIIGLGGSATNDGGTGMLRALGMKFFDKEKKELNDGGGSLGKLNEIDLSSFDQRISESSFIIACDVDNPLVGTEGASYVFGPQKGATFELVKLLDNNLLNYANIVEKLTGISLHNKQGAGAAGGAGGAFQAFFQGDIKRGIDVVLNAISFVNHLSDSDLVLTGEGKTDAQTFSGKTPFGIAEVAYKEGKPVILISGLVEKKSREMLNEIFTEVHSIVDETISTDDSIEEAFHYLKLKTFKVIKEYLSN